MLTIEIEFDGRYKFPYRVMQTQNGIRRCYSRHKTRQAADASASKFRKAMTFFNKRWLSA